jgi:hypothetical protein
VTPLKSIAKIFPFSKDIHSNSPSESIRPGRFDEHHSITRLPRQILNLFHASRHPTGRAFTQPRAVAFVALAGRLSGLLSTLSAEQPDTLLHSIPAPPAGTQTGAWLGYSVAADGAYTVVGAPYDDFGDPDSGVVKVFHSISGALVHVIPNPTWWQFLE